jgi:hypothetical protein
MKKLKLSLLINIIITILTIFASFIMFTGIKITHGAEPILETSKIGMFKFFTVDSNILMGITSLIFVIKEIKKEKLTKNMYRLKLMSTTAVTLTFIVVFTYLGPISENGIISLLQNSNIFFHLIIPILSIINLTIFEKTNELKFKDTIYGMIPTIIYAIGYITNIIIHVENGKVSPIYDWYWFVQNGITSALIVAPMILLMTYIISLILWKLNKRRTK